MYSFNRAICELVLDKFIILKSFDRKRSEMRTIKYVRSTTIDLLLHMYPYIFLCYCEHIYRLIEVEGEMIMCTVYSHDNRNPVLRVAVVVYNVSIPRWCEN